MVTSYYINIKKHNSVGHIPTVGWTAKHTDIEESDSSLLLFERECGTIHTTIHFEKAVSLESNKTSIKKA